MEAGTATVEQYNANEYLMMGLEQLARRYGPEHTDYRCALRADTPRECVDQVLADIEAEIQELLEEEDCLSRV